MDEVFFAKRLAMLRMSKGVSARDMSLSLGQSESYINKIENGKAYPSMQMFFYICDYLKVTPQQFFAEEQNHPAAIEEAIVCLKRLEPERFFNILRVIKDLSK